MAVKHPIINSRAYERAYPDRMSVFRGNLPEFDNIDDPPWAAQRGEEALKYFPTHAEAIAYAQKIARQA